MALVRLIAVNRFYRPDHAATAQHLTDLAEHLAAHDWSVTVICSRISYDKAAKALPAREQLNGVNVRRVWTSNFGRGNLVARLFDYATFYVSAFAEALVVARRGDVLLAKTDPPIISAPIGVVARIRGAHLVNWCQDLFPEIAQILGVKLLHGPLGAMVRSVRDRSLKRASVLWYKQGQARP